MAIFDTAIIRLYTALTGATELLSYTQYTLTRGLLLVEMLQRLGRR